jgi:hypothetical protein
MGNMQGWGEASRTPPFFSAWSQLEMGWIEAVDITEPGTYEIEAIETPVGNSKPKVYKIGDGNLGYPDGEYLLIENRQAIGFDRYMPQSVSYTTTCRFHVRSAPGVAYYLSRTI